MGRRGSRSGVFKVNIAPRRPLWKPTAAWLSRPLFTLGVLSRPRAALRVASQRCPYPPRGERDSTRVGWSRARKIPTLDRMLRGHLQRAYLRKVGRWPPRKVYAVRASRRTPAIVLAMSEVPRAWLAAKKKEHKSLAPQTQRRSRARVRKRPRFTLWKCFEP
jgi:hypothetical protein